MDVSTQWMEQPVSTTMAWPFAVVLGVGLVLLIVLANGARIFRGTRAIARSFWCPLSERYVDVEFRVDAWDGRRVGVETCSAFTPPTAVVCDKRCLEAPAARPAATRWVSPPGAR